MGLLCKEPHGEMSEWVLPFAVHNGDTPDSEDTDVSAEVHFGMCYATPGCGPSVNFVSVCTVKGGFVVMVVES